jgi:regulatory protein
MELHQLIDDHLLSDSRFTEIFISSRKEQGKGPLRIESELQKRGIDAALITSHLANVDENEWSEIACDALEKKLGKGKQVDYDKKLKFMRFLSNRGFKDFQVIEALKHFASSDNNE